MTIAKYADFSIGNVFSKSFGVIKENFLFFISSVIVIAILYGAWGVFFANEFQDDFLNVNALQTEGILGWYAVSMIAYFCFSAFLNAFFTKTTMQGLAGKKPDVGGSLTQSISILLPMIGLQFFYGTFMTFCFILLIIPGVIVFLNYYVAAQVRAVENLSVMQSMQKSKNLMKGHRLAVLGVFIVLYIVLMIVVGSIAGVLVAPLITSDPEATVESFQALTITLQFALSIPYALFWVINIVFSTVIYRELINEKEGGSEEELSDVFV